MFGGDFLALLVDFLSVLLELFEFVVQIVAAASTAPAQEGINIGFGTPFVSVDTGLDDFVGGLEVFSEEVPLILIHKVNDLIVLADDDHGILT